MKKVTIYDIAKKMSVSPATVTRAMNGLPKVGDEKRKLILETAERMGYRPNKIAATLARKEIKIAVIIYGAVEEFYNKLLEGTEDAYKSLQDFNLRRDLFLLSTLKNNDADLIKVLNEIEGKCYDGIVLNSINDTPEIAEVVERLIDEGVVVYTINTDISTKKPHYCVMNNGEIAGRIAAELLDWMVENRKVCNFMGGKHTQVLLNINKAFLEEAKRRELVILDSYFDDGNMETAYKEMDSIIKDHPDVGGIYVNSAISEPICRRLVELNMQGKIKIVTSDLIPSIVDNIRSGVIQATIFQDPYLQGKLGFSYLYRIIADGFTPDEQIFITPQIVMQNNIDNYLSNSMGI